MATSNNFNHFYFNLYHILDISAALELAMEREKDRASAFLTNNVKCKKLK